MIFLLCMGKCVYICCVHQGFDVIYVIIKCFFIIMGKIIRCDGVIEDLFPLDGSKFCIDEIRDVVGCIGIGSVDLRGGSVMFYGLDDGLRYNGVATSIYNVNVRFPDSIRGDVLVCGVDEVDVEF